MKAMAKQSARIGDEADPSEKGLTEKIRQKVSASFRAANADLSAVFMTRFAIKGSMIGANSTVPRSMDVSNNGMVFIGPTIQEFYMMKIFDCSHNNLTTLPEDFASLQSLEKLDASHNRLLSLPIAVSTLHNLKIILLSNNELTIVSKELCSMRELRILDIQNNRIRNLPIEFGSLLQLHDFRALGNPFESPNLAVFASGQNALNYSRALHRSLHTGIAALAEFNLSVIPLEISHVAYLQTVDFRGNKLTSLSEHLFKFVTLLNLNFSNNKIVNVSSEISKLTNLTSANFSDNEIVHMCPEIGSISGLLKLNLEKNPLITPNRATARTSAENVATYMKRHWNAWESRTLQLLHMDISNLTEDILLMTGLQSLNLSHNSLAIFPSTQFFYLESLDLSDNRFTEAPKSAGMLSSLRRLSISGCRCSKLPSAWKNSKMLQSLALARNGITEVTESFFREFDALTELDISFNSKLLHISDKLCILTCLMTLDISGTAIKYFSMDSAAHIFMRNLKMNSMPELQIKNIDCNFHDMTTLEVLGIGGDCMIHPLTDNFSSLTNLKEYSTSGNIPCIPYTIARSPNLRLVSLIGCKNLMSPSFNIANAGASAIIKYLQILWNSHLNQGLLDLSDMQIESSILNFAYMEHIIHADFSNNLLTDCEFLGPSLTNLQSLNLSRNQLGAVSETISHLTALRTLLLDSNLLESLPDAIGSCNSLQYVSLLHNPMKIIPLSLGRCKSLNRVYVDQTQNQEIQNFPSDIQGDDSAFFKSYLSAHDQIYWNHMDETTFKQERYEFSAPAIGLKHIPKAVLNLTKLQRLNLSLNSILKIPEDAFLLVNLLELNLNFCGLSVIPSMTNKLTNITHLCLAGNRLTSFDVNMSPMSSIQKLWLQDNNISKVTKSLERCLEIRSVILRNNRLKTIPLKFWKLRYLAELGLEGNPELEVPPAELVAKLTLDKCCAFLKAFDEAADIGIFDGSSLNLTLFPLGTFRIATLTNLSIRDNHIMHIPDEISNIKNLKYFDLRQNPCRRLPPTMCTLNIIEIHCDQETFTCPPPLIISQGLQKINWFLRKFFAARLTGKVVIRDEKLAIFEFFEGDFDSIKTFDVKAARLQEIPAGIKLCTALTDLQLNDNHISLISDEFCECWSLRKVSFSNNRLSQNMNMSIAHLQLLADIDVSGNFLSTIPEAIFGVPNILTVNVSNNRIRGFKVPAESWRSLTQLDLSKNEFTELPLSLFDVISIKVLQLAENQFFCVQQQFNFLQNLMSLNVSSNKFENLEGLRQLCQLKSLNASNNKVTYMSHEFGGFSDLQELQLDGNPLDFPPIEVTSTGSQNTLALMRQFHEGFKNGSLDIQAFGLRSLSIQLLSMDHLIVLNARNNSIFSIPQQISFLTTLQELYLDNNRIGCIPTQIHKCIVLAIFSFKGNPLTELPASMCMLRQLTVLHADYEHFKIPPASIWAAGIGSIMFYLECMNTKFAAIESQQEGQQSIMLVGLNMLEFSTALLRPTLIQIDISMNKIKDLPLSIFQMPYLQILKASGNRILRLHSSISKCDTLLELKLDHNEISNIPASIGYLSKLQILRLEHNNIQDVHESFGLLLELTELGLHANPIKRLPMELSDLHLKLNVLTLTSTSNWEMPTQSIISQGRAKILEFLRQISQGISKRSINISNEDISAVYIDDNRFKSNLVQLNCSENRIGSWPSGIFLCGKLEKVNLKSNCIMSIPSDISQLKLLEFLDLSFNSLSTIPECIGNLNNLNSLLLEHNNIQTLPETLSSLQKLKVLNVAENKLSALFWGINKLLRLQVLVLDLNELIVIPDELFDLFSLEELWLAGNKISRLSSEISMLKRLRIVQLTSNRLMSIPAELSHCDLLEELLFAKNLVSIIPTEIGLCVRLTRLEYDDNPITHPLQEILSLGNIYTREYLQYCAKGISDGTVNLSSMQLKAYPYELTIVAKTVTDLDLSRNELREIPSSIALCELLEFLDLSQNFLSSLPTGLEACRELKGLDIEENQITELHFAYSSLTNLVALNTLKNPIVKPNEAILEQGAAVVVKYMVGLSQASVTRSLDLSSAGLLYVPREIVDMSFLTALDLDDNKISELPEELMEMRHLREFHIDGNSIMSFPRNLSKLQQLQELYFAENGMTSLPKILGQLTNLKRLSFIGNPIISPVAEVLALPTEKILLYLRKTDSLSPTMELKNWLFTTVHMDILKNTYLETFNMQANRIKTIPSEFAELISLKSVNFEENLLSEFPKPFFELKLQNINLSKNYISTLPESIRFLTAITKLNLSQNRLSAICHDIIALNLMKTLILHSNMLTMIPESIGELASLRTLDVRENPIFSLPFAMHKLTGLKRLKIDEASTFIHPPTDIVKLGTSRCIDYFKMREQARHSQHLNMSLFNLNEVTVAVYQVGSSITSLDLSKNHIYILPKEFSLMNSLVSLDLSSNMLNAVPQILDSIPVLKNLNVADNKGIFCIDAHVEHFYSLVSLNLDRCSVTTVPEFLMKMSKLESLIVGIQSLTELKSLLLDCSNVGVLPGEIGTKGMRGIINYVRLVSNGSLVRQLDLSWTGIHSWPDCLHNLQQIRKLNVSHNLLAIIPDTISLLVDLTFLDVSTNLLKELPASISACTELIVIMMRHNDITFLPESMGDLLNIDQLDVDFEKFESPPASVIQEGVHSVIDYLKAVGDAVKGTHLGLSNGKLIHFPAKLGTYLTHVQSLNLEECELLDLHPAISYMLYLVEIALDSNYLTELPNEIGELKQLQYFSANMNRLRFIPESIGDCESLTNFQIQHNNVLYFPISFGKLKKIRQLQVDEQSFICPPTQVWKRGISDVMQMMKVLYRSTFNRVLRLNNMGFEALEVSQYKTLSALEKLSMSKNRLYEYSNEMCLYENLVELVLKHNQLASLPRELSRMRNIAVLQMAWNRIIIFPDCICELKQLIELDMSHNEIRKLSRGIMNLQSLTDFDISFNNIEAVAPELASIPNLISFKYSENPKMIMPPVAVQLLGQDEMLRMLRSIFDASTSRSLVLSKFKMTCLIHFDPDHGFSNTESLTILDISNNSISEIPSTIQLLQSLEVLKASRNRIEQMPKELEALVHMKKVDFSRNALIKFPDEFIQFSSLQDLKLSGNRITSLPRKLNELHQLKSLSISNNGIREFPDDISQLDSIQTINVSGCGLLWLPSTIGCLNALTHLILPDNRITAFPGSIGSCKRLIVIDASHNKLERLPNSLCDAHALESMDLRHNSLLNLTHYMGRLTNLTMLLISNNTLINGSKSLGRCSLIRSLDLSFNNLDERSLQDCVIPSCTTLSFSNNSLKNVQKLSFEMSPHVQSLSFEENDIILFPLGACNLGCLTELVFSKNKLHALPHDIGNLTRLQTMSLDNNRIVMLPSAISRLRLLSVLHLDSNCIKELCEEIGRCDCLKELFLHANDLETLPVSMQALTSLKLLTLSNNRLSTFPDVLDNFINIDEVWLQNQKTGVMLSVPEHYRGIMRSLQLLML